MRVFIVTYLCSVVGVYTCAVDAEQCIRALKRVGCDGATLTKAQQASQKNSTDLIIFSNLDNYRPDGGQDRLPSTLKIGATIEGPGIPTAVGWSR